MSAAPKLELESGPYLRIVEGGRETMGRTDDDRREHPEGHSIGWVFLIMGVILVAPTLWYFFLMLLLPIALVQLASETLKARGASERQAGLRLVEGDQAPTTATHSALARAA